MGRKKKDVTGLYPSRRAAENKDNDPIEQIKKRKKGNKQKKKNETEDEKLPGSLKRMLHQKQRIENKEKQKKENNNNEKKELPEQTSNNNNISNNNNSNNNTNKTNTNSSNNKDDKSKNNNVEPNPPRPPLPQQKNKKPKTEISKPLPGESFQEFSRRLDEETRIALAKGTRASTKTLEKRKQFMKEKKKRDKEKKKNPSLHKKKVTQETNTAVSNMLLNNSVNKKRRFEDYMRMQEELTVTDQKDEKDLEVDRRLTDHIKFGDTVTRPPKLSAAPNPKRRKTDNMSEKQKKMHKINSLQSSTRFL